MQLKTVQVVKACTTKRQFALRVVTRCSFALTKCNFGRRIMLAHFLHCNNDVNFISYSHHYVK